MGRYQVQAPDGSMHVIEGPDNASPADIEAFAAKSIPPPAAQSYWDKVKSGVADSLGAVPQAAQNLTLGAVRGAGSIGATLIAPLDAGARALGIQNDYIGRDDRRQSMTDATQTLGADPNSLAYKTGKLGAEIAGTAGVGGMLAKGAQGLGMAPEAINALRTSGFSTGAAVTPGLAGTASNIAIRSGAGALAGGAQVGLVSPGDTGTGAAIGAALPGTLKLAGSAIGSVGKGIGNALTGPVSDNVKALAQRAQELGIDVPVDRIANSKPLNALASTLNYVPLSGRTAVEDRMVQQLGRAASKTMGQDTPDMVNALKGAQTDLGAKFDTVLKNNPVPFDHQLLSEVADAGNTASRTLGSEALAPINAQIKEIVSKGSTGQIDGEAAYNIKRELDTIANGGGTNSSAAIQLKRALMGALDRGLGPDQAKAFAQTRQQYGNMLDLQGLAQNGAEGPISVAKLANMKNIGNPDLQELADIANQFVKTREGAHGAAQRVGVGAAMLGGGHLLGGVPGVVAGGAAMGTGRLANMALDSSTARNALINGPTPAITGKLNALAPNVYRAGPRAGQN